MIVKKIEEKRKELKIEYMSSLLSKKQVAKELGGVSTSTIDRMRQEGLLRSKSVRGSIMFTVEEIARFLVEG